jgi:hypothetical protein
VRSRSRRIFFAALEEHSFTNAFEDSLPIAIGLFLVAAALSLALPRTAVAEGRCRVNPSERAVPTSE